MILKLTFSNFSIRPSLYLIFVISALNPKDKSHSPQPRDAKTIKQKQIPEIIHNDVMESHLQYFKKHLK